MISFTLLLLISLLTCAGQLCQKQAVMCWRSDVYQRASALKWLIGAVILLAVGMLFWLRLLQILPLGIAYPMLSINFILVTLAGKFFYQEKAGIKHWSGVVFIMLGILLMSLNE
ncbi:MULTISPECIES: 4-amino-4-deoxy-L-arabinose-phosphoundecaprenol flippase subunit ArnE [Photorhabdus]|uniref:Probable 4-amino-4-deoxy-L-arabinose-phosphoundecaprenol flippase subunit ArnE n=1 Tax=Photorhabdus bodei TaxID=2029681 RepID=A0A329XDT8_9GAMM|nr:MULTISPECIES: 4-amino-4-deoxy-L-arabinose-phosphoundecaprenol flippase subunit ArnE [Photorhabdus]MCT8341458.1 EamA family transporter [Photorhabdus kleinii]NDK99209.1 EamA family transporter [Photorhabdus bodei]NDL03552.1 EamA family transporter [Photorhabdus bodei]NDL07666.1 EamA family transporter [Photorhabdus bodei]RAX04234.1 4-amino-4-deoxy-L-arabinose-phospho-UDP flippase [Photorhabdus sp. S9-53]